MTDTSDASATPAKQGIFWIRSVADGLWLDGRKVMLPSSSKAFVIRSDGEIVPVELSEAEVAYLEDNEGRLSDGTLIDKFESALAATEADDVQR